MFSDNSKLQTEIHILFKPLHENVSISTCSPHTLSNLLWKIKFQTILSPISNWISNIKFHQISNRYYLRFQNKMRTWNLIKIQTMLSPVCLTFLGRRMCDTLSAISAEWHMKSEGSPNLESHETITQTQKLTQKL